MAARRSVQGRFGIAVALLWAAVVGLVVVYPLVMLFRRSVEIDGTWTLANYREFMRTPGLRRAALHSLVIASSTTAAAVLVGVPYAWLVVRTDLPGRHLFRATALLTFAAPGFIATLGWILLLGPRSGYLNTPLQNWFDLERGPFDIFSVYGIVFVITLFLYPFVFLPMSAALENIDPSLEEAAASIGVSRWRIFRDITLPLTAPVILAGATLVFVSSFIVYGPVALLGRPNGYETLPTAVERLLSFPPNIGLAAVVGVPTMALLALLLWIQRRVLGKRSFTVVGGRSRSRSVKSLGRWRWPSLMFPLAVLLLSLVLPFGVLLVTSFRKAIGRPLSWSNLTFTENYRKVFDHPQFVESFRNSALLAMASVAIAVPFCTAAAWLVERGSLRVRGVIPVTMSAALAFPGAILAVALILAFAGEPFSLGGSFAILLIAYVVRCLPLMFSYLQAGYRQIGVELEEASRSVGASQMSTAVRVTFPLLATVILPIAGLTFILNFRDLDTSIFLNAHSTPVVAVTLFDLSEDGVVQVMGGFAMVVLACNLVIAALIALALRISTRRFS